MKAFLEIIKGINNRNIPHLNPTEIYNEGWMTRLLVYYSIQEKIHISFVDFNKITEWSSEALISSPFIKVKEKKEGYTHADIVLGDFSVNYEKRGEVEIKEVPSTFGIIEAKMGSDLSKGTTNAPKYNQASRNLACIAFNTYKWKTENTFFGVVAPMKMIEHYKIREQLDKATMIKQIEERYAHSNLPVDTKIIEQANRCNVFVITYKEWIAKFDNPIKKELEDFYEACLKWNKI